MQSNILYTSCMITLSRDLMQGLQLFTGVCACIILKTHNANISSLYVDLTQVIVNKAKLCNNLVDSFV